MPGKEIKGRSKIANYRHGGRIGFKQGSGFKLPKGIKKVKRGYDQEFTLPKGTSAAAIKQSKVKGKAKVKGKGLGSGVKPSESRQMLKEDKITRLEYLKQWSPAFGGRSLKKEMKAAAKKPKK